MSHHTFVPSDVEPTSLEDLISDARTLVTTGPRFVLRQGARAAGLVHIPVQRVLDITDDCVARTAGYGE